MCVIITGPEVFLLQSHMLLLGYTVCGKSTTNDNTRGPTGTWNTNQSDTVIITQAIIINTFYTVFISNVILKLT